ncbi:hypothetical protein PROFUN_05756 [Planoprotostelium fungivorum]|uniref:Rho-GAP domain-containing protein n=1 Tax=Planoprotostelium fungivorum TaxID=1890364 RepID=A0A2P6NPW1_9EUKA|nr:hypothetical protein PROFUN_05756 [Planoprotostelium fungivorum]
MMLSSSDLDTGGRLLDSTSTIGRRRASVAINISAAALAEQMEATEDEDMLQRIQQEILAKKDQVEKTMRSSRGSLTLFKKKDGRWSKMRYEIRGESLPVSPTFLDIVGAEPQTVERPSGSSLVPSLSQSEPSKIISEEKNGEPIYDSSLNDSATRNRSGSLSGSKSPPLPLHLESEKTMKRTISGNSKTYRGFFSAKSPPSRLSTETTHDMDPEEEGIRKRGVSDATPPGSPRKYSVASEDEDGKPYKSPITARLNAFLMGKRELMKRSLDLSGSPPSGLSPVLSTAMESTRKSELRSMLTPEVKSNKLGGIEVCEHTSVISAAVDRLTRNGYDVEGVFRVSGSQIRINEMKKIQSRKGEIQFDAEEPHAVASYVKMLLRTAKFPLIPQRLRPLFILSHKLIDTSLEAAAIPYIRGLLSRIPAQNFKLLHKIMFLCSKISQHQETSLMTDENLSTTLGLAITPYRAVAGSVDSAADAISESSHVNSLALFMIQRQEALFDKSAKIRMAVSHACVEQSKNDLELQLHDDDEILLFEKMNEKYYYGLHWKDKLFGLIPVASVSVPEELKMMEELDNLNRSSSDLAHHSSHSRNSSSLNVELPDMEMSPQTTPRRSHIQNVVDNVMDNIEALMPSLKTDDVQLPEDEGEGIELPD